VPKPGHKSKRPPINLAASEHEETVLGVQRTVKAGFVSTFTQKFFTSYKNLVLQFINDKMKTLELQEVCSEESFGQFFSVYFCRTDQVMSTFSINIDDSYLLINNE